MNFEGYIADGSRPALAIGFRHAVELDDQYLGHLVSLLTIRKEAVLDPTEKAVDTPS